MTYFARDFLVNQNINYEEEQQSVQRKLFDVQLRNSSINRVRPSRSKRQKMRCFFFFYEQVK